jgi:hypothetical protein
MRKLAAFILLIPLGILFTGAVNIASVCQMSPQKICSTTPDQCCHKDGTCEKAKKSAAPDNPKSERPSCCFDCPLCALITVPAFIQFEPAYIEVTTEYAVMPDNNLKDYFQKHWKPPADVFFS